MTENTIVFKNKFIELYGNIERSCVFNGQNFLYSVIFDFNYDRLIQKPVRIKDCPIVFDEALLKDLLRQSGNRHPLAENEVLDPLILETDEELLQQIENTKAALNNITLGENLLSQNYFRITSPLHETLDIIAKHIDLQRPTLIFPILQFVNAGNEGSGKSTLLERLSYCAVFPRGITLNGGTRCIIRLCCRRSPKPSSLTISVRTYDFDPETLTRTSNFFDSEPCSISDAEKIPEEVRKLMKELFPPNEANQLSICFEKEIILHVQGPDFPDADFVDCPGLVQNDQKPTKLLEMIIEQESWKSVFLLVVPKEKYRQSLAAKVLVEAKKKNPKLHYRSILVFTNVDTVRAMKEYEVQEDLFYGDLIHSQDDSTGDYRNWKKTFLTWNRSMDSNQNPVSEIGRLIYAEDQESSTESSEGCLSHLDVPRHLKSWESFLEKEHNKPVQLEVDIGTRKLRSYLSRYYWSFQCYYWKEPLENFLIHYIADLQSMHHHLGWMIPSENDVYTAKMNHIKNALDLLQKSNPTLMIQLANLLNLYPLSDALSVEFTKSSSPADIIEIFINRLQTIIKTDDSSWLLLESIPGLVQAMDDYETCVKKYEDEWKEDRSLGKSKVKLVEIKTKALKEIIAANKKIKDILLESANLSKILLEYLVKENEDPKLALKLPRFEKTILYLEEWIKEHTAEADERIKIKLDNLVSQRLELNTDNLLCEMKFNSLRSRKNLPAVAEAPVSMVFSEEVVDFPDHMIQVWLTDLISTLEDLLVKVEDPQNGLKSILSPNSASSPNITTPSVSTVEDDNTRDLRLSILSRLGEVFDVLVSFSKLEKKVKEGVDIKYRDVVINSSTSLWDPQPANQPIPLNNLTVPFDYAAVQLQSPEEKSQCFSKIRLMVESVFSKYPEYEENLPRLESIAKSDGAGDQVHVLMSLLAAPPNTLPNVSAESSSTAAAAAPTSTDPDENSVQDDNI
jgi:hypothetical protein